MHRMSIIYLCRETNRGKVIHLQMDVVINIKRTPKSFKVLLFIYL